MKFFNSPSRVKVINGNTFKKKNANSASQEEEEFYYYFLATYLDAGKPLELTFAKQLNERIIVQS
jgi:hypothetical protein